MRRTVWMGAALLAIWPALAFSQAAAPKKALNTLADVQRALRACWRWPPTDEVRAGLDLTFLVSFKRDGEILGARITYQTPNMSDEERSAYYEALLASLSRCSPLPLTKSLGAAIAGRPMRFHIHDTRQERKA